MEFSRSNLSNRFIKMIILMFLMATFVILVFLSIEFISNSVQYNFRNVMNELRKTSEIKKVSIIINLNLNDKKNEFSKKGIENIKKLTQDIGVMTDDLHLEISNPVVDAIPKTLTVNSLILNEDMEIEHEFRVDRTFYQFENYLKKVGLEDDSTDIEFYKAIKNFHMSEEGNKFNSGDGNNHSECFYLTLPGVRITKIIDENNGKFAFTLNISFDGMPKLLKRCYKMVDMMTLKAKISFTSLISNKKIELEFIRSRLINFSNLKDFSSDIKFDYSDKVSSGVDKNFIDVIIVCFSSFGKRREIIHKSIYNENGLPLFISDRHSLLMLSILASAIRENSSATWLRDSKIVRNLTDRIRKQYEKSAYDCNEISEKYLNHKITYKVFEPVDSSDLCEILMNYCCSAILMRRKGHWINSIVPSYVCIDEIFNAKQEFENQKIEFFKSIYYDKSIIKAYFDKFPYNQKNKLIIYFILLNNIENNEHLDSINVFHNITQLIGESFSYFSSDSITRF